MASAFQMGSFEGAKKRKIWGEMEFLKRTNLSFSIRTYENML